MTDYSSSLGSTHRPLPAVALLTALLGVTACGGTASVEPAPYAHDPVCADVMMALPEEIGEYSQRSTTSQGTAAWGEPSAVVLRCGVEPIGPTEHPCVAPSGVDWVWIEQADHVQLISYGREPTVEILLDGDQLSEDTTMNAQFALSEPVSRIEQTRECIDLLDADEGFEDPPSG